MLHLNLNLNFDVCLGCRCRAELLIAIVTLTVWQRKRQIKIANIVLIYTWALSSVTRVLMLNRRALRASYVTFWFAPSIHLTSSVALIPQSLIQNVSEIYFEHENIATFAIKWAHFDETKWVSNLKSFVESEIRKKHCETFFWWAKFVDTIDFYIRARFTQNGLCVCVCGALFVMNFIENEPSNMMKTIINWRNMFQNRRQTKIE